MKNIFKVFRNYIEFVFFIILKNILGLFSFNFASNVGGILVGFFGKFTKYEQIIKNNLKVLKLNDEKSSKLTKENLKDSTSKTSLFVGIVLAGVLLSVLGFVGFKRLDAIRRR